MRLIDADAYAAEMKDRQDAARKWRNEAIAEEDEVKLARAEGAFTAFTEAKLTMDKHIISPWHRVEEEMPDLLQFVVVCNDEGKCVVAQYVGYQTDILTPWRIAYTMYDTDIYDETECGPVRYWMHFEPPKEDA